MSNFTNPNNQGANGGNKNSANLFNLNKSNFSTLPRGYLSNSAYVIKQQQQTNKQPLIMGSNPPKLGQEMSSKELMRSLLQKEANKDRESSNLEQIGQKDAQGRRLSGGEEKYQQAKLDFANNQLKGYVSPIKNVVIDLCSTTNNTSASSNTKTINQDAFHMNKMKAQQANGYNEDQSIRNASSVNPSNLLPKLILGYKQDKIQPQVQVQLEDIIDDDEIKFIDYKKDQKISGDHKLFQKVADDIDNDLIEIEDIEGALKDLLDNSDELNSFQKRIEKDSLKDKSAQNQFNYISSSLTSGNRNNAISSYNGNYNASHQITNSSYVQHNDRRNDIKSTFQNRNQKEELGSKYYENILDQYLGNEKSSYKRDYIKKSSIQNQNPKYSNVQPENKYINQTKTNIGNSSLEDNIKFIEQYYNDTSQLKGESTQNIAKKKFEEAQEIKRQQEFKERARKHLNMDVNDKPLINHSIHTKKVQLPSSALADLIQKRKDINEFETLKKMINERTQHLKPNSDKKMLQNLEAMREQEAEKQKQKAEQKKLQKKNQDELFGELFDYNEDKQTEEKSKDNNDFFSFLDQGAFQNKDHGIHRDKNDDEIQNQRVELTREQKEQAFLKLYQEEREAEMKQIRWHNRKTADELIKPILNLDLIQRFSNEQKPQFEQVPLQFESFQHYRDTWIPLFLYETYNQMINQRTDRDKEKQQAQALGLEYKQTYTKKNYFQGYVQRGNSDQNYIYLHLYESASNVQDKNGNYDLRLLDSLKEFDLLYISEEPLPVDEVKKVTNLQYLLKMRDEKGKMLCMVHQRRKKDKTHIVIKVDSDLHEDYVRVNIRNHTHLKVHVYFFDSLSTTIREFRTIKSCEFYPTAKIILNPQIYLCDQMAQQNQKFNDHQERMRGFVHHYGMNFNESQRDALKQVYNMKKEDFLLIQGPQCLQIQTARRLWYVDLQMLQQMRFYLEQSQKDYLEQLRSMDYDPLPLVKKFTLDSKVRDELGEEESSQANRRNNLLEKFQTIKERLQQITTITRIISTDQIEQERSRLVDLLKLLYRDSEKVQRFLMQNKDEKLKTLSLLRDNYEKEKQKLSSEEPLIDQKQNPKTKKKDIELAIIRRAQIICTTLSMSASEKLEAIKLGEVEYLIVDEACQCVELTNLIPFEHEPKKVILVGDQQQLTDAEDVQKRINNKTLIPTTIRQLDQDFRNLIFFDLKYSQESQNETSKSNLDEANFIKNLFNEIIQTVYQNLKEYPSNVASYEEKIKFILGDLKLRIGIISPYKQQVKTLKDIIYPRMRQLGCPNDLIEINTVDAYQGREKDIIIISCVRGSQERQLGFLNDYRRMNVAITRAKNFLWVIGNSRTLKRNKNWNAFLEYTKSKIGSYVKIKNKDQLEKNKIQQIVLNQRDVLKKSKYSPKQLLEDYKTLKNQEFENQKHNEQSQKHMTNNQQEKSKKKQDQSIKNHNNQFQIQKDQDLNKDKPTSTKKLDPEKEAYRQELLRKKAELLEKAKQRQQIQQKEQNKVQLRMDPLENKMNEILLKKRKIDEMSGAQNSSKINMNDQKRFKNNK
ncbi:splicing endonuclease positive effector [Stylonychia lemnae]|uniref:Splicing endonuclease positive effector n=1 Tax=Stylonychia lemnae TaxID=5949 RepID=A0A077ZRN2_STYLE|nr:splicing endonuclease positive effector [Stylonychia lemnae]|eukprot:CDW72124.1 splicing endonuclease positive effector [Stylonychia lemnae]